MRKAYLVSQLKKQAKERSEALVKQHNADLEEWLYRHLEGGVSQETLDRLQRTRIAWKLAVEAATKELVALTGGGPVDHRPEEEMQDPVKWLRRRLRLSSTHYTPYAQERERLRRLRVEASQQWDQLIAFAKGSPVADTMKLLETLGVSIPPEPNAVQLPMVAFNAKALLPGGKND